MMLRDLIRATAEHWPEYKAASTVAKTDPLYQLIVREFPNSLGALAPKSPAYHHEGSTGRGNVSAAPWVASFDRRLTRSAQSGFYPVFLFSTDMLRVYLSFALGVTQFEQAFGRNRAALERIRHAARRLRELSTDMAPPQRLAETSIDLRTASAPFSYKGYESGTILAFPAYEIANLPDEEVIRSDYLALLTFYQRVVESPAIPEIGGLVEAAIVRPEGFLVPDVQELKLTPKEFGSGGGSQSQQRLSAESRKVGWAGELVVLAAEKRKLREAGRSDLAERIDHVAARGETPGWDISSFDLAGQDIYIEVKSSKEAIVTSVEMTANEWQAAINPKLRSCYFVYLVTMALSERPLVATIRDPYSLMVQKLVKVAACRWLLSWSLGDT